MLAEYAAHYRRDLFESVVPFWQRHALDHEFGGYFSCLDADGAIYDTKKYMWLQGRGVWMFSRLYNEVERRQEWLDAATLICDFMRRHGRDPQGRVYFSLTREGRPVFYQRKPYAAVFYVLGLLEYARATGSGALFDEADALFWRIGEWIARPELMDRLALSGQPAVSNLADVMVLASMALEFAALRPDARYDRVIEEAMEGVRRHYDAERRILVENVPLDGRDLSAWPEGRLFNPGHAVEVAWFLLHMLERFPDAELQRLALDALEGSLELGWDAEHDGLFYFVDTQGRPLPQLEANMKLWWPHTEAIYALVLAHTLTGEERWAQWLKRVHDYSYAHFADLARGEWFGYCDRQGNLTHQSKGGPYKGFFHVPRALLFSIQRIERAGA
jgi:N-acylglucosamine 2-epimerase